LDREKLKQNVLTDEVIVIFAGRMLDNNNAHIMADCLSEARKKGHKFAIIDMAELEFLSSAGVGSILGSIEDFRDLGGDIVICNASTTILHIFNVLDLGEYLKIMNTQQEAIGFCK
jgi:anti-sigma B factor antagonist